VCRKRPRLRFIDGDLAVLALEEGKLGDVGPLGSDKRLLVTSQSVTSSAERVQELVLVHELQLTRERQRQLLVCLLMPPGPLRQHRRHQQSFRIGRQSVVALQVLHCDARFLQAVQALLDASNDERRTSPLWRICEQLLQLWLGPVCRSHHHQK